MCFKKEFLHKYNFPFSKQLAIYSNIVCTVEWFSVIYEKKIQIFQIIPSKNVQSLNKTIQNNFQVS